MLLANNAILDFESNLIRGSEKVQITTLKRQADSSGWNIHGGVSYLLIGPSYHLNCCGSSPMSHVDTEFVSERQQQNFACFLLRHIKFTQSYHFIASSFQLKCGERARFGNVATLLRSLGAREVDTTRNRNHGRNTMNLHIWNPTRKCGGGGRKYLHYGTGIDDINPLWFHNLTEREKLQALLDSQPILDTSEVLRQEQKVRDIESRKNTQLWDAKTLISRHELDEYLKVNGWSFDSKRVVKSEWGGY